MVCKQCQKTMVGRSPLAKYCLICKKERYKESRNRWLKSEKSKVAIQRWNSSDKCKALQNKYYLKKGHIPRLEYLKSITKYTPEDRLTICANCNKEYEMNKLNFYARNYNGCALTFCNKQCHSLFMSKNKYFSTLQLVSEEKALEMQAKIMKDLEESQ